MENTHTITLEPQPITNVACSNNPGLSCPTGWLRTCTGNPCLIDTTKPKSESGQEEALQPEADIPPDDDPCISARIGGVAALYAKERTEA